ncbi:hypothetical protein [Clostridium sp.]|uniref:hypothetical protein n=1 Tax=Clostridium sp. TaxID=1506 RepID=UPI0025C2FBAD|nr:hypothetical protein [Clostridium sp.]
MTIILHPLGNSYDSIFLVSNKESILACVVLSELDTSSKINIPFSLQLPSLGKSILPRKTVLPSIIIGTPLKSLE